MKHLTRLSALLILFLAALTASGQNCFHITNGMSSYTAFAYDATGTKIEGVVYVDGSDSMSGTPPCPSQVPGAPRHTAYATAKLTSTSGHTNSSTSYYQGCYNCYLSTSAMAALDIGTDTDWSLDITGTEVVCSSAGLLVAWKFPITARVAETYGSDYLETQDPHPYNGTIGIIAHYTPKCTAGVLTCPMATPTNQSRTWNIEFAEGEHIPTYLRIEWLTFYVQGVQQFCVAGPWLEQPSPGGTCK